MVVPELDRRTTPAWARPLALIFLASSILYLFGGYRVALGGLGYANRPAGVSLRAQGWFWGAQYHMFNEPHPTSTTIHAEVQTDRGAEGVDLPALYPTLRVEGPSYGRRFYQDPAKMSLFAQDICRKHPGRAVRIWTEQRAKRGGTTTTADLGRWPCPAR